MRLLIHCAMCEIILPSVRVSFDLWLNLWVQCWNKLNFVSSTSQVSSSTVVYKSVRRVREMTRVSVSVASWIGLKINNVDWQVRKLGMQDLSWRDMAQPSMGGGQARLRACHSLWKLSSNWSRGQGWVTCNSSRINISFVCSSFLPSIWQKISQTNVNWIYELLSGSGNNRAPHWRKYFGKQWRDDEQSVGVVG